MASFPTTVATDSDLYIAVNAVSTQLTDNPLSAGATTVNVTSTAAFPTVGFISIDNEIIKYTGKTGTSFTSCTRAADGTSATSHVQNSQVFHNVIAIHHNVLKDELISTEQFISDLIGRVNTQIKTPDGSVSVPSHSFASETNTGMYRPASNQIGFTVNGTLRAKILTTGLTIDSGGIILNASGGTIQNQDGSASLPAFTFGSDTNTGIYRSASDIMDFVTNGVGRLEIKNTGVQIANGVLFVPDGSSTNPSITFDADQDTGIYRNTTNWMAFVTGGTVALNMRSDQRLHAQDGSVTFPIFAFINDEDCGLYRIGTNNIALGTNGTRALEITSAQAVKIKGTVAADSATAGDVGEFVESVQNSNVASPGNNQWFDITSISLTAGDWDVWMIAGCNSTNYSVVTDIEFGTGTVSGNTSPGNQMSDWVSMSFSGGHSGKINQTFYKRFNLSATTTVYAKALFTFSAGTQNGIAKIFARRVR